MSIVIEGEEEFIKAIDKIVRSVKNDKIEPVLKKGAGIITKAAKAVAPVRKDAYDGWKAGRRSKPPGVLKKAIRTKKLRPYSGLPSPYMSGIDRKAAPHAHFVHDGTNERIGGPKSKRYRGRKFGRMTANPFFREAWDANKGRVIDTIGDDVKKLVEGAVK